MVCDQGRDKGKQFFGGGGDYIQQKEDVQTFRPEMGAPLPQFPPLVGHPDLAIWKSLRRVIGLLTLGILKRLSKSIFFQTNTFTACKVKDENEVANSLMVLYLHQFNHLFQGKKHLRT